MIKECKICKRKYYSKENEYNTIQYMDNMCEECADNIIRTSDGTST
jgi:hypothetical protein